MTTYRVRWGEPTDHIASRFGTSPSHIEKLNDLESGESARAGVSLFVPAHVRPRSDSEAARSIAGVHGPGQTGNPILVVPSEEFTYPDRQRVFYQPVLGDSAEDVAEVCNVTATEVRHWNHLDRGAALQDGMTLQLFVPKDAHLRDVLLLDPAQVETVPVASNAFHNHFLGKLHRERIEVVATQGDTWSGLANRYGLSVGMLERINQKSRSSKLHPGEHVVVYARQHALTAEPSDPEVTVFSDDSDDDSEDDSEDDVQAQPEGPTESTGATQAAPRDTAQRFLATP